MNEVSPLRRRFGVRILINKICDGVEISGNQFLTSGVMVECEMVYRFTMPRNLHTIFLFSGSFFSWVPVPVPVFTTLLPAGVKTCGKAENDEAKSGNDEAKGVPRRRGVTEGDGR